MPFNFLELLKTYQKKGVRRTTRRRRDLVAELLDSKYDYGDRTGPKIVEALKKQGLQAAVVNIYHDVRLLRATYQYLTANPEDKEHTRREMSESVERTGRPVNALFGVWCCTQDNIETWEQILGLKRQYDEAHPTKDAEEAEPLLSDDTTPEKDGEVDETSEQLPDVDGLISQAVGNMVVNLQTLHLLIGRQVDDREADMKRIKTLAREIASLQARLSQASDARAQDQEQIARLQQDIRNLEEKLRIVENKKLSELLLQTASEGEAGRRIYALAQQIEAAKWQKTRDALLVGFPDVITKQDDRLVGRHIIYEDRFVRNLKNHSVENQERGRAALCKFSELGPYHSSFKTHDVPQGVASVLPQGCKQSRVTDELRFIWRLETDEIRIYCVGNHTDFWPSER